MNLSSILVNWFRICSSLKSSGLEVRNLIQFNLALLEKWLQCDAMKRGRFCGDWWCNLNIIV